MNEKNILTLLDSELSNHDVLGVVGIGSFFIEEDKEQATDIDLVIIINKNQYINKLIEAEDKNLDLTFCSLERVARLCRGGDPQFRESIRKSKILLDESKIIRKKIDEVLADGFEARLYEEENIKKTILLSFNCLRKIEKNLESPFAFFHYVSTWLENIYKLNCIKDTLPMQFHPANIHKHCLHEFPELSKIAMEIFEQNSHSDKLNAIKRYTNTFINENFVDMPRFGVVKNLDFTKLPECNK